MKKIITAAITLSLMAVLLAVSVLAVDFTVSPAATGEILGDANGDGKVSSADVIQMKRLFAGTLDSIEIGADANGDGKASLDDILNLKRNFAGMEEIGAGNDNDIKIIAVDGVDIRNMVIVAPEGTDKNSDNAAFAADQLRRYLRQATGYEYVVEYGAPSEAEHAIYIQYDPTIEGEGDVLEKTAGELGEEGFIIEVRDGNIYITGGRLRGCMYGVFEFLEEYIGYRFISADETYTYKTDIINLKSGIYDEQQAALEYRHSGGETRDGMLNFAFPRKVNSRQMYSYDDKKTGYQVGPNRINAHSYGYYRYYAERDMDNYDIDYVYNHPDEFSWEWQMPDYTNSWNSIWQPCFTDDYDKMFYGLVECSTIIHKREGQPCIPGQSQMSFSINDNTHYCTCADCKALYARIGVSGASLQFASRAADDIQQYFPGLKLYSIIYEHTPPADEVYISENLVLMYCGTGCNNHVPGTGECGDNLTVLGTSNKIDEVSLPGWATRADSLYFWEYGVNYHYYLAPCPNVLNIYDDLKFVIDNGGEGLYYENTELDINFEKLKGYIALNVMWDTDMTEDECRDLILEYLYIRYGEGYNELYRLIELLDECGNDAGCFINNFDRPWEMYNPETVAANFEEMISLLKSAYDAADTDAKRDRIEKLSLHVYFLGLCATYEDVYVNGSDADAKAKYEARYEWLWNYLKDNEIVIFSSDVYTLPEECTLNENPMVQFYDHGSNK